MEEERYSQGMKILFYALAVLLPIVGIIIGIVLMTKEDEESKALGKNVLIVGIVVLVLACCCSLAAGFLPAMLGGTSSYSY
jgi:cation transport ATPase